ncbi:MULTISPECIES: Clp protease N-terminal domain-containing protein [Streptomycetaceae]|uniref:Peptidase n=1 Tax=Streptantibioticus cattleyicolor (strain ATCC 35852 / DSM 46488 / JCM 4925 / NBRC 14057 / NRRL 8057) TaxID=1003195 RepID=F8JU62_STREN|nr:Clp protease N-terminal domain-containing protein [Streptantibioticus cattleyicolor]AEW93076.1 hypothetical protein SCATT_07050 [Streptantibioticus cattleyicolor NRRL 8057 = DSM 46488]MYS57807.1 peptidase [Streptomyces sp. SID5468]CCB73434.1 conserved protein of unknown function [Streptantibioticus cattleyicolor NRRL 8057 = DSM 46488]
MHSDIRPEDPASSETPPPPAGDGASAADAAGPRYGPQLGAVVFSARRRAARDGDRQTDTAHLLHSLLETDPGCWETAGAGPGQLVRVLAYLVQRTIGYGMRWRGTVEDSGAIPVAVARPEPGWSPAATAALRDAAARAAHRGAAHADGADLLAALAADPECRAAEVLRAAGVDPAALTPRPTGGYDPDCQGRRG